MQEKPQAISTVFHPFESSAFDNIYHWLNQDINSIKESNKISSGKDVFPPSLMTWICLNYKMDRERHSILSNSNVHVVILCNYAFKLYSFNKYQVLGSCLLFRQCVSHIDYALYKRTFPLIHFALQLHGELLCPCAVQGRGAVSPSPELLLASARLRSAQPPLKQKG